MRLLAILLLGLAAAACVADTRPETCDAPTVEVALTVSADTLSPGNPAVCRGQVVTLHLTPEVDGVFHIHGLDDAVSATEITAGDELELTFTAEPSGQFPIELHPAGDPEGISIGIFTIHEP
jgi:hypothetical protein